MIVAMLFEEENDMDTELIGLIGKGVTAAAVAMALTWGTVEWVLPVENKHWKRGLSLLLGLGAVFILQEAHFVHFGMKHSGEAGGELVSAHNRWAALAFGLMAGGLTPLFHSQVIARFAPMLKKKRRK